MLDIAKHRFLLDTGASGLILFDAAGYDISLNHRSVRRVSNSAGHRTAKSGRLRSLEIGDVSFSDLPVTVLPGSLGRRVDGLLPGTLFDAIYFDHRSGVVTLNPALRRERTLQLIP